MCEPTFFCKFTQCYICPVSAKILHEKTYKFWETLVKALVHAHYSISEKRPIQYVVPKVIKVCAEILGKFENLATC